MPLISQHKTNPKQNKTKQVIDEFARIRNGENKESVCLCVCERDPYRFPEQNKSLSGKVPDRNTDLNRSNTSNPFELFECLYET